MTMYNYQKAYRGRRSFQLQINAFTSCQLFLSCFPLICLAVYGMKKGTEKGRYCNRCYSNILNVKKEYETADCGLTDTLTMVDMRERNY